MTAITSAVRADLAPMGKVRGGINYGNFILASKDPVTGESSGVAIALLQEIARRLDVPPEIVAYESVAVMGDAAPTNAWDLAFLGSDPQRAALMDFTPAYLEIDATYVVAADSPLVTIADVDRAEIRVAAPARANYELFLRRSLQHAQLVSTPGVKAAVALFAAGEVHALAGLKQALLDLREQLPGSRILEGRFMGVQQSMAVPKGRTAGLAYLRGLVEDVKASGLVARAIAKTGAQGVSVASPSSTH